MQLLQRCNVCQGQTVIHENRLLVEDILLHEVEHVLAVGLHTLVLLLGADDELVEFAQLECARFSSRR